MLKMQDMPEEMLDEFDREVDLMNKLRHKNIGKPILLHNTDPILTLRSVQFVGASKVVGRFALVTEFMDKGNVANVSIVQLPSSR
jgi:serine/threonine protein kinase